MSSFGPGGFDAVRDLHWLVVGNGAHLRDDLLGFFDGVERIAQGLSFAFEAAILAQGILGLNFCAVAENERAHVHGGGSGKDRAAIAELGEEWEASCVIKMTVGDKYGVEFVVGAERGAI